MHANGTATISNARARELILDLFEQEVLVIGALTAFYEVDDELVWRLVKNLDVIRARALRRVNNCTPPDLGHSTAARPALKPHPAIEDFLLRLRRTHERPQESEPKHRL